MSLSTRRLPSADQLYGTWDLVSFVRHVAGEAVGDVLGPDPVGRISYHADGRMSALLMQRDRPWPTDVNFTAATAEMRGAAAMRFGAYGGWFEIEGDVVTHHVDISLYPDHVGTDLVRQMRWEGDALVLRTEELLSRSGRVMYDELAWRPLVRNM